MAIRDSHGRFARTGSSSSSGAVTSKDHGYDALLKRVREFAHPQVAMGILEADGAKAKEPWPEGEEVEEGLTVIDVGTWAEFGTDTEPERSFVRAGYDAAAPELREAHRKLMKQVVAGKMTKEQALDLLGAMGVGAIQKRIADGIDPPNAPETIERKGSSKPLIASGQLRSSVHFAIREAGDK